MSIITMMTSGAVNAVASQKRRDMSRSSGSAAGSAVMVRGSRAIPQMGHDPGASRTISGCIGHVHSVRVSAAVGVTSSSAIPHLGHEPGRSDRTSGCMGQVYVPPPASFSTLGGR